MKRLNDGVLYEPAIVANEILSVLNGPVLPTALYSLRRINSVRRLAHVTMASRAMACAKRAVQKRRE